MVRRGLLIVPRTEKIEFGGACPDLLVIPACPEPGIGV